MRLACVVGARPNFIKMAPLLRALESVSGIQTILIHTGQHYDENLSDVFFDELGMRRPDTSLEVGSGSHATQTAQVLQKFEAVLLEAMAANKPFDRVVVVGDVNSTMAAALAAVKLEIPVAHVEAGLRSSDRSMPEEINRIVADTISDLFFVSEPAGIENLLREGHSSTRLHLVGNIMIDTLEWLLPKASQRNTLSMLGLKPFAYGLITLHRPSNVDSPQILTRLFDVFSEMAQELPLVFPIHPRTQNHMKMLGLEARMAAVPDLIVLPPMGYLDFLALTSSAKVIITDSGGLQEESTALGIPCLTLRSNTERPITVSEGTSTLIGSDPGILQKYFRDVMNGNYKKGTRPELWDGRAAERIARILADKTD